MTELLTAIEASFFWILKLHFLYQSIAVTSIFYWLDSFDCWRFCILILIARYLLFQRGNLRCSINWPFVPCKILSWRWFSSLIETRYIFHLWNDVLIHLWWFLFFLQTHRSRHILFDWWHLIYIEVCKVHLSNTAFTAGTAVTSLSNGYRVLRKWWPDRRQLYLWWC